MYARDIYACFAAVFFQDVDDPDNYYTYVGCYYNDPEDSLFSLVLEDDQNLSIDVGAAHGYIHLVNFLPFFFCFSQVVEDYQNLSINVGDSSSLWLYLIYRCKSHFFI